MTFLEQQEDYAQLEPAWTGAMEAAGAVEGLSRYTGRSSIYHSPAWADTLEHGEVGRRGSDSKPRRRPTVEMDAEIVRQLRQGCSYGAIARQLGCSLSVPRRLARKHGIDRRQFSNCETHRQAMVR